MFRSIYRMVVRDGPERNWQGFVRCVSMSSRYWRVKVGGEVQRGAERMRSGSHRRKEWMRRFDRGSQMEEGLEMSS